MTPGPCAKTTVTCTLVMPTGERFVGTNWCRNAQKTCPRLPGEDYTKCTYVCSQVGHAEVDALRAAGGQAHGAHAYIEGHTYACQSCQEALFAAGVVAVTIGAPPELKAPPSMQRWEVITDPFTIRRLNKTSEELNELAGRIARTLLQGWDGIDPKDGLTNREHFARETADVIAQIKCNFEAFDMEVEPCDERVQMKYAWMRDWEAHYAADKANAASAEAILAELVRLHRVEQDARDTAIAAVDAAGYRISDKAMDLWSSEKIKLPAMWEQACAVVDAKLGAKS